MIVAGSLQATSPPQPPLQPLQHHAPEQLLLLPQMQGQHQEQHQEHLDLGLVDMIDRLDRILQGDARCSRPPPTPDSIRVHVGIDEDLKMILEMDPSIVDMVPPAPQQTSPRFSGLPPRG